ncbi:lysosome-associated membrane glycoprotein 5-like [Glandiceps talaboti]
MALGGCVMERSLIVLLLLIGVCLVQCAPSISEEPTSIALSSPADEEDQSTEVAEEDTTANNTPAPPEPTTVIESKTTKDLETTQQSEDVTTIATEPIVSTNSIPATTSGIVVPSIVNFTLEDKDGKPCLKAIFSAIFKIGYYSGSEEESELKEARLALPQAAKVDGECDDIYSPATLKLQWFGKYTLKMTFDTNQVNGSDSDETGSWCAKSIHFTYDSSDEKYFIDAVNPGSKSVKTLEDVTLFDTPLKSAYICQTQDNIAMQSDDEENKVILSIADLQLQPYDIENGQFGEGSLCEADKEKQRRIDSTVPIAVGAALGCLILLVIIVYAIGRQFGALGTGYSGYKSVD